MEMDSQRINIMQILARRRGGFHGDGIYQEKAIKDFVRDTILLSGDQEIIEQIQELFPKEYGEAIDEHKLISPDKASQKYDELIEEVLEHIRYLLKDVPAKGMAMGRKGLELLHMRGDGNEEQVKRIRMEDNCIFVNVLTRHDGEQESRLYEDNYPLDQIIKVLRSLIK